MSDFEPKFEITEEETTVKNVFNKEDEEMFAHLLKKAMGRSDKDPLPNGMIETPHRLAKYWTEVFAQGYLSDPIDHLKKVFKVEEHMTSEYVGDKYTNGMVVCKFKLFSHCEHHIAPFGTYKDNSWVYVAYIPDQLVVGLSKIPRMARGYAHRFQIQEKLTQDICDALWNKLKPKGVMVVMKDITHSCVTIRGAKSEGATTTTSCVRGDFATEPECRAEALSLFNSL